MINICFFIGSFQSGGAEKHLLDKVRNIDKSVYNPFVVVMSKSGIFLERFEELNIPIFEYKHHRLNFLKKFVHLVHFIFFLKQKRIKIIHVHLVGSFWFALTAAKFSKVPNRIISLHNIYTPQFRKKQLIKKVSFGCANSTSIVAVSNKVKLENSKFYKIDDNKISVIYNGVDSSEFNFKKKYKNSFKKEFNVCVVGSLTSQKGHLFLLKAVNKIKAEIPNLRIHIYGDGPLREKLNEYILQKNLKEKIILKGKTTELNKIMMNYDLFLLPSIYEGFSIALLEAMACALPIIASDVGGNSEALKNSKNGIIIQPKNINELSDSLIYVYNNPKEAKKLGINARADFLKNFTLKKMILNFDNFYNNLLV